MINSKTNGQQASACAMRMTDRQLKDICKQENQYMKQQSQMETTLWQCETCHTWWGRGSNIGEAAEVMQNVARMPFPLAWDEYYGWFSKIAIITCPRCGQPAREISDQHTFLHEEALQQQQNQPNLEVVL